MSLRVTSFASAFISLLITTVQDAQRACPGEVPLSTLSSFPFPVFQQGYGILSCPFPSIFY